MLKTNLIAIACLSFLNLQTSYAQTAPSASDILRNIEQNKTDPQQQFKRPSKKSLAPATTDQGFARLKEIKVQSPLFQKELLNFWVAEINKPVPAQKLSEFKAYAWDLFQSKGYLAYITTSAQPTPEGSVLTITVSFPSIANISVVTVNGNDGQEFSDEVIRRFNAIYQRGNPVDIQGIENQLNAASYDLPVDLEVSLRQVNSTDVDVVINLRKINANFGTVLSGVLQVNNYGLGQFGQNQMLGSVRVAGFTPTSELALTTQSSTSVDYYRADYEAPIQGRLTRWRVYASQVQSKANSVKGWTDEAGIGLTRLLHTDRIGRWLSGTEISRRQTQNWASDALSANRIDQQARFKLRAESSKGWVDNFNNEIVLTMGQMNLDRLADDKSADALSTSGAHIAGTYKKIEMNGGLSNGIDADSMYIGAIRWRTQAASKNLDSYSRISLGGLNGIRAYTTLDGVGDQGAQVSLEVTRQLSAKVWMGPFYDFGVVKTNHAPMPSSTDTSAYLLQGAGFQFGGSAFETNWNLSIARSYGKTPESWTTANTKVGSFRLNAAITRPF
jgi:hemolysin activation/secretion protein